VIEGRDSLKSGERERNLESMVRQPSATTLKKVQSKHYLSGTFFDLKKKKMFIKNLVNHPIMH
jgi:hypothetical protein